MSTKSLPSLAAFADKKVTDSSLKYVVGGDAVETAAGGRILPDGTRVSWTYDIKSSAGMATTNGKLADFRLNDDYKRIAGNGPVKQLES